MPATAAAAAGGLAGGAAFSLGAGTIATNIIAYGTAGLTFLGTSAGLSIAAQEAFGPDVPNIGTGEGLANRISMSKKPVQPHRVIYGRTKVGADLTFYTVNESGTFLHMICTFAGHPCEAIETVYVNNDSLQLNKNGVAQGKYSKANLKVNKHNGSQTTVDSDAKGNIKVWDEDHIGKDKTYIYLRAKANNREDHRDLFNSGMPDVKAIVKGKNDIYDPRSNSTGYTNNSALCVRDFITSKKYGYNFSSNQINTSDVTTAANVCDETVNGKDRFQCNGTFRSNARKDQILQNMLTSMAGKTTWSAGKQRIIEGAWRAKIDTYGEDDIVGSISQSTKKSRNELYNAARAKIADPERDWQPTTVPEVTETRFQNEDDGVKIPKDFELNFTTDSERAQRILSILLRQHRRQKSISTTMSMNAFRLQAGDNIGIKKNNYNWNDKKFTIDNKILRFQGDKDNVVPVIELELSETDEDVFDDPSTNVREIRSPALSF